jgi:hypothetical protein
MKLLPCLFIIYRRLNTCAASKATEPIPPAMPPKWPA